MECYDGREAWHPIDPTIGSVCALHLALGTPWLPRKADLLKIIVKEFAFAESKDTDTRRLRWYRRRRGLGR